MKLRLIRTRWMAICHDLLWVPLALFLAFSLRFNLEEIPLAYLESFFFLVLIAVPVQFLSFSWFGLYRGIWRFASLPDLLRILRAVALGATITFTIIFIWKRMDDVPRSVMVLYPFLLMAGLALPRLLYRWLKDQSLGYINESGQRALIIGAGHAGEVLVRDLLKGSRYLPVAFLDDDARKQGLEIHGIRVAGNTKVLEQHVRQLEVDVVLLAMPRAKRSRVRELVERCASIHTPCKTLPLLQDLKSKSQKPDVLREVRIEDLLGRDEITLDDSSVRQWLKDKRVLVTGAGGSIGSELCRQILVCQPDCLVMLDHSEFNLYSIDQELGQSEAVVSRLGDIRDRGWMEKVLRQNRPHILFNAAAYKHVPLVELNPTEGIKTNVGGTCDLADLAVSHGCKTFVQVSTDKAVNPTNIMGATKRIAEIYCQNLNESVQTAFITTRFGNVLGSAGSVVPLFRRQIEEGGPVTVTHPDITRYFMTIPEAVSLILEAGCMGQGGEIFVLDMGDPIKIVDLAHQMIRLSGQIPDQDIAITFTGLRPGEKLYEELFHGAEAMQKTRNPKIMLSAARYSDVTVLRQQLGTLRSCCEQDKDMAALQALIQQIVPEYQAEPSAEA